MQLKILFVLFFCCFTFGIPVVNTESPEPPIDSTSTNTCITANRLFLPWPFSLLRGERKSQIQAAINMCRNSQAHFLGSGAHGSAWKVDLPSKKGVIQVVLKVIADVGGTEEEKDVAKELHNLRRVEQLVEWGEIKTDKETVCYILMPSMGMKRKELLKQHPNFRENCCTLKNQSMDHHIQVNKMEHHDGSMDNVAFREETKNGKQEIVAHLVDWGLAKDLTDPLGENIPTSLDDKELGNWKGKIVDDKMGRFPK